ncbi:MAG TPA: LuxR C-terminal-related transcriptional regulator [Novosphingobium sp.]|nr:LuxR C-terminal-related transcriptional regulator [Novosphingobium sp.]
MRLFSRIVDIDAACIYLVDKDYKAHSHGLLNISYSALPEYVRRYASSDPFYPARFAGSGLRIVHEEVAYAQSPGDYERYFTHFMGPMGLAHEVEILFRDEERILAGVSLLRSARRGRWLKQDLQQIEKVHSFVEYSVIQLQMPKLLAEDLAPLARHGFSNRQIDVIRMLRNGATNAEIARYLCISVTTVKTHLQQIYSRASVSSRTELLSKLFLAC